MRSGESLIDPLISCVDCDVNDVRSCLYAMDATGNKEGVACISGILKSLSSRVVLLEGEVDRKLGLVDEGLGYFGLKDVKFNKGKAQWVLSTPLASPTPKKNQCFDW